MRRLTAFLLLALSASCLSVQDFNAAKGATGADPTFADASPPADGTWRWEWINPAPTGKTLRAISGTSERDIWVAGEGGTISHFDGTTWDIQHVGLATTRYFSVGTRAPNDVWAAGTTDGQVSVVHFDGKEWIDSYPFAGAALTGFSHGTGPRLFAIVDWGILELSANGKWEETDTHVNDIFGAPADIWVSPSGEAWTMTGRARIMRLRAGAKKWEMEDPLPGVPGPAQAVGLAISGVGSQICALYTDRGVDTEGGAGFLRYDGATWHAGPRSTMSLTVDAELHGARSACLVDGTSFFVDGTPNVVQASETSAPRAYSTFSAAFPGLPLLGAVSFDGKRAYAAGALGAFVSRGVGEDSWRENGPTVRKELLGVDVGLDGAVMVVDTLQPDHRSGGDVLFWQDGALKKPDAGDGFSAPSAPDGVAVIARDDAWIFSNAASMAGVTHWTGAWGLTRPIEGNGPLGAFMLAIWAPAKNDTWLTGREFCPNADTQADGMCATKAQGFAWHHDGKSWTKFDLDGVYRSIHGTGPNDVWFAGEGAAHWDGKAITSVAALTGQFRGVWSSAPDRVWLWGEHSVLFDGKTTSIPLSTALNAATEWDVSGIAESTAGDVFVLTKRASGTSLLWFDPSRTRLREQVNSDLALTTIRGRGDQLWAVGAGGAALRFAPPKLR